jgi:hypothetical protein
VPAVTLTPADLAPFAEIDATKAQAMIDTALARAARVAPCIRDTTLSDDAATAAKGVIRDAVLRWNESGAGAVTQQTAGPYSLSVDTRQFRRGLFTPNEEDELRAICREHSGAEPSGAFSIDQVPTSAGSLLSDRPDLWFQWVFPIPDDAP